METTMSVKNLSVRANERLIVENITFEVGESEVVLLSGANGSGKSTILKAIVRENTLGKAISGSVVVRGFGDILSLTPGDLQRYRASIGYVHQRDDYAEMGSSIRVRDIISSSNEAHSGRTLCNEEVNEIIDKWIPLQKGNKRIFDAKSKPAILSGGEQRLLSVLSVVATRSNAGLLIIDEPLNNLDFANARNISNLINSIVQNHPKVALLLISHCRIFPFVTREIKLTPEGIIKAHVHYVCHSCLGELNEQGFYNFSS